MKLAVVPAPREAFAAGDVEMTAIRVEVNGRAGEFLRGPVLRKRRVELLRAMPLLTRSHTRPRCPRRGRRHGSRRTHWPGGSAATRGAADRRRGGSPPPANLRSRCSRSGRAGATTTRSPPPRPRRNRKPREMRHDENIFPDSVVEPLRSSAGMFARQAMRSPVSRAHPERTPPCTARPIDAATPSGYGSLTGVLICPQPEKNRLHRAPNLM